MVTKKKKEAAAKPLEKMTAKELRELAKELPEITGAHGMNKVELISAVKKAKGIVDDTPQRKGSSNRELKQKIRVLKAKRKEALSADDKKKALIARSRISKLKKKTRKV